MIFTQSEGTAARCRFPVYLVDATDGITPETGEAAGQPQISKAGGAWANTTNTLSALGNGAYYVELTSTELNTLGPIQVRYKSANTAEFNAPGVVVAYNQHDAVRLGITALPAAAADAAGGLIISDAGGLDADAQLVTKINDILTDTGTTLQGELDGIQADTEDIQTRIPAALTVDGNIKADTLRIGGTLQTANDVGADVDAILVDTGTTLDGRIPAALGANGNMKADVRDFGGTAGTSSGGRPEVNATHVGGTIQTTGQDVVANVTTLLTRITSALFAGITSLAEWLGLIAGKQSGNATARTELRATGAGSGTFDETTDSQEAIRDNQQTAAAAALTSYDPPTNAEMEARTLAAASYATSAALAAVAADLPTRITKNTALAGFVFPMYDSADHVTPKTGLTITAQRSLDGAALASCANSASEISNGLYKIDLAAGDLNGNTVTLRFTATGADATIITLATQPT